MKKLMILMAFCSLVGQIKTMNEESAGKLKVTLINSGPIADDKFFHVNSGSQHPMVGTDSSTYTPKTTTDHPMVGTDSSTYTPKTTTDHPMVGTNASTYAPKTIRIIQENTLLLFKTGGSNNVFTAQVKQKDSDQTILYQNVVIVSSDDYNADGSPKNSDNAQLDATLTYIGKSSDTPAHLYFGTKQAPTNLVATTQEAMPAVPKVADPEDRSTRKRENEAEKAPVGNNVVIQTLRNQGQPSIQPVVIVHPTLFSAHLDGSDSQLGSFLPVKNNKLKNKLFTAKIGSENFVGVLQVAAKDYNIDGSPIDQNNLPVYKLYTSEMINYLGMQPLTAENVVYLGSYHDKLLFGTKKPMIKML